MPLLAILAEFGHQPSGHWATRPPAAVWRGPDRLWPGAAPMTGRIPVRVPQLQRNDLALGVALEHHALAGVFEHGKAVRADRQQRARGPAY